MSRLLQETTLPGGALLQLVQGDLTLESVEAIVNAANAYLEHGGGVAAAISRRGGPLIQRESDAWVRQHGPVTHAEPAYTRAGDLPCRYVIHVVGPIWGEGDEDAKLAQAVQGALRRASELDLNSLALPAISAGIYGFPKGRAAGVIYAAIHSFFASGSASSLRLVRLVVYDQPTLQAFLDAWRPNDPSAPQDKNSFLRQQYARPDNLKARINLHTRFSANTYGWFRWIFDHYRLPEPARLLELGCGQGILWLENQPRLPAAWELILTDYSAGMLGEARRSLSAILSQVRFSQVDAQALPFASASFAAVIANHMLFHMQDLARALSEIRRVLKPGGTLFATTIGEQNLQEIEQLRLESGLDPVAGSAMSPLSFTLQNGAAQLSASFARVNLLRYPDALHVTEAEPLADFILSTASQPVEPSRRQALIDFLQAKMAASGGAIHITKDPGMFIATAP
jgi:O-acetyl-ADP-ribose deacetylase (regulator of RNase III)/SAM-dependent methyltransferase